MRRAVERFSWLMYEIALKYACPVSDIIAEDFLFMRIQLSEHFTYRKLLRFTLPSVIMMVCASIYGVVDGVFVSNFVGSDAFAAVNLIMPFLMVLGAVGFMLGTGGSALVAYTLGAGNEKRANEIFSLLIYVLIGLGVVFTIGGIAFLTPMSRLLGADETMLPVCVSYGRIVLLGLIPYMLQNTFQSFLVTAERPQLSLYVTIAAGVTNIVLDALFVAVLQWGAEGAALATILSQFVGGVIPLAYFLRPNSSKLRLGRTAFHGRALLKACANGSSEFMTNISMSVVNIQEFNQIDGRISSLYHAAALKMGLSDNEFRILYTLAVNAPGYLQSALREATGMGRSTVNSALKKLEREGILTLSSGSGRHTCVSLTAQGHRLADRTVCRLIRLEDHIYAGWTSEEQALLLRLNRDFTEKLEAIVASL